MYEVICVGSALLDVYVKSDEFVKVAGDQFVGGWGLAAALNGKVEMKELTIVSGGAGTNTAVSFARKGIKTALIAEMGYDLAAATIREECLREGVDLRLAVVEEEEVTGVSVILVHQSGERTAAIYRGASRLLTKEDIDWEAVRAKWLYISSLGGEMALMEGLIGHAKRYGIRVAVNPGRNELERVREWGGAGLFEGVEVLIVNREEAEMLYQKALTDEVWQSEWLPQGGHYVVITDGRNGGRVSFEGKNIWYTPQWVEAVEETGAGDAFGSGLVAGLMMGKSIETAVEWGKKQAASVVQYMGGKRGLLDRHQLGA